VGHGGGIECDGVIDQVPISMIANRPAPGGPASGEIDGRSVAEAFEHR
jgi:hypothetical protein